MLGVGAGRGRSNRDEDDTRGAGMRIDLDGDAAGLVCTWYVVLPRSALAREKPRDELRNRMPCSRDRTPTKFAAR